MTSIKCRVACVLLFVLFAGGVAKSSFGSTLEGKYYLDVSRFIVFENGEFTQQYVTREYRPESSAASVSGASGGVPGLEQETVCIAKGSYSVSSSTVNLTYETDSCGLKSGQLSAEYDATSDLFVFAGDSYRKEGTSSAMPLLRSGSLQSVYVQPLTAGDIEAGVAAWQWQVAQAMQDLNDNDGGIWYCSSGSPRLDESYWTWSSAVGDGAWVPNNAVNPSEAIDWYFGDVSSSEGCTECLMAARSVFYKGLLDTIGPVKFDAWFEDHRSDLAISNYSYAPSSTRVNKPVSSESDLERGDWVYIQNWVTAQECSDIGGWQGENAITQNFSDPRTYIGLGIPSRGNPPVTLQVILDKLRAAWENSGCPETQEGKLRTDVVMAVSPSYLEEIVNNVSLLEVLQPGAVTDISGTAGMKRFFKLVVPDGTSNMTISTSGGTGDCNLYIMKEQWPTEVNYDYSSVNAGNDETVVLSGDISGAWYVMIDGTGYDGVSLVANADVPPQDSCINTIVIDGGVGSGEWDEDCLSAHRQDRYAKYYTFTLTSETRIVASLESSTDTYLYLLAGTGPDGTVIAQNDDSNGTYNSQIITTLPAGDYTLEATTYSAGALGEFSIELSSGSQVGGCLSSIDAGETVDGTWVQTCSSTHLPERYARYYSFSLSDEEAVTIDLQSQEDTFLFLLDGEGENGSIIAYNDDSNGTYNSQIVTTLPAGDYTVEATTYDRAVTGDFTVSVKY